MKDIASMLKRQSPTQQLPSDGNGWIELLNGRRWNPSHVYKFNTHPLPLASVSKFRGVHANLERIQQLRDQLFPDHSDAAKYWDSLTPRNGGVWCFMLFRSTDVTVNASHG
ncbi:hypothetical protein CWS02_06400 [Enterobacter sp. EA-1]|nr:hypothetical protein CWS02_06400 [Enterobacter sp. EA-1]